MGFKRPFDDEKFHELPLKHCRQLDYSDKSIRFEEFIPYHAVLQKPIATVVNEEDLCKSQVDESFDEESDCFSPGHNMDDSFTWVPPKLSTPCESLYSYLLDQPAKKQVPIGPDHQAKIPEWKGRQSGNRQPSDFTVQNHIMGCADGENLVGKGREFCVCKDKNSIRCVRQHIKEAREEMVKVLGSEKFRDLGLCDMGEDVAFNWSEEDALLFQEVVYSDPVTSGRNFWQHLEDAFCCRSKKEIVSYYFNVFVLRRRATQNRNYILDIDSDDDEWHGIYDRPFGTQYVDEEDSAIKSPLHQGTGLCNENRMNAPVEYMAGVLGSDEERLCMTFELANDAVNSDWTNCKKKDEAGLGEHQKVKESNKPMCPKVSTDGKDLRPTCSIMEELYGHGSWENIARNK